MKDFTIFREENLFNVAEFDFLTFRKYLQVLMGYSHPFQSSRPGSLDKLYFFQDLWFLSQYGKQYKAAVTEKDVTLKKVRLAFLEYLVTLGELEIATTLSEQERFVFCYRYLMELFDYSRKRAREEASLQGIREDYYGALNSTEETAQLQQKVIERYYSDRFKQGYLLAKLFQEKLVEVKQICLAMQEVCGLCVNNQQESIEHFIQAVMKAEDLLEIAFWKKKFKEQGLSTLFEHDDETVLPMIVVCAQQSDDLLPFINMQIGLICAILVISEEEARDFVYIPYAEQIGKELYCEKGQVMTAQYMEIVQQFLGGNSSPNYRYLLNIAFTMLKLSSPAFSGEIVLICDDKIQDSVPQNIEWKRAVQRYKEERNIRILVLYSGQWRPEMSVWFADRVIFIEEFQTKIKMM
ncbi:MAG: hypothetical protein ABS949_07780 [Solibacillus sp.]